MEFWRDRMRLIPVYGAPNGQHQHKNGSDVPERRESHRARWNGAANPDYAQRILLRKRVPVRRFRTMAHSVETRPERSDARFPSYAKSGESGRTSLWGTNRLHSVSIIASECA